METGVGPRSKKDVALSSQIQVERVRKLVLQQRRGQTRLFSGTYRQFSEPLWNLGHIDNRHAKENTNTLEARNVEVQ